MTEQDWPVVRRIYAEGIATRNATFEATIPDWEQWTNAHLSKCRFVACSAGQVLGWAALAPVSSRSAYAGVAEVSVYVAQDARGRKVGSKLLSALIEASEREGIWTLQAGIFPENTASIRLVKRHGFHVVGRRVKIGRMAGRWRDVLLLERRSTIVGK